MLWHQHTVSMLFLLYWMVVLTKSPETIHLVGNHLLLIMIVLSIRIVKMIHTIMIPEIIFVNTEATCRGEVTITLKIVKFLNFLIHTLRIGIAIGQWNDPELICSMSGFQTKACIFFPDNPDLTLQDLIDAASSPNYRLKIYIVPVSWKIARLIWM